MKYLQPIALVIVLTIALFSCKKNNKGDDPGICNFYDTDSSFIHIKEYYTGWTTYYGLPGHHFPVNSLIKNKLVFKAQGDYGYKSINCFLNGVPCDFNNITELKVGANILKAELVNCKGRSSSGYLNCDCPPAVTKTETIIYGLDTVRLLIKKIRFTKQYPKDPNDGLGFDGGYPDVYLIIDNFKLKSGARVDYNAAKDGAIDWAVNDTFVITKNLFNMRIQIYDTDWPLQDDYLGTWLVNASDIKNWETGTHILTRDGTLEFEVEKLK